MQRAGMLREYPKLKRIVAEASRALARLDSARLEELAVSCRAFNRDLQEASDEDWTRVASESREATPEMVVFRRVLDATRRNLDVINRLREQRAGRMEYSERQARGWLQAGTRHGDN
jgi:hypothetical protein